MKSVDLSEYGKQGIGLYSGNPRGVEVRRAADLDGCDRRGETVTIIVPPDVFAVTASFLSGLVGPSIRRLGEAEFRERYKFVGRPVSETLEAVIRYAAKERGAL